MRVFIAIHYLEIGGAEMSLIGLLNSLDYSRCDVDLFVYRHHGELMKAIPKQVNLLPEIREYAHIESPMVDCLKAGCWRVLFGRLSAKLEYRKYTRRTNPKDGSAIFQIVADRVTPSLPSLESFGEYDMAVSFLTPHNIVIDKVRAKQKVAWIHTDYTAIDVDVRREEKVWKQYDRIVSISEHVTKTFLQRFPALQSKIVEIENILSPAIVRARSKEEDIRFNTPKDAIRILSIGRFTYPKNFDNVPDICRRLRETGLDVYWFIIGFGGDEHLIKDKIVQSGMQDYVILLGKKENPYPYISACDIYVQPSRYEGRAVTVREAQILCKPIAVTDYATARSQIESGKDGIIVPMDNEHCAEALAGLIRDKSLQRDLSNYLAAHDYGNESEVEKFYRLME